MSSQQDQSLSKTPSRATARLGRHLEKNLLAYTTAAGAGLVTFAMPAEAEIIYTPSNTPMVINGQNHGLGLTQLDLNNDGTPDFAFGLSTTIRFTSIGYTSRFKFLLRVAPNQAGNQVAQGQEAGTAAAIAAGRKIGSQQKFGANGYLVHQVYNISFKSKDLSSGSWRNVEFAYVGLKITIDGQVHYGWARIKFPYPYGYKYPSIYGYAYESIPNQPIIAGQTSGTYEAAGAQPSPAAESPDQKTEQKTAAAASTPATLGALAAGMQGINLWRSQGLAGNQR
jgi:hypothetical protein